MSPVDTILPLVARRPEYRVGGEQLLGPIDFEINGRGRTVVLGPNGAGKTTTIRLLVDLVRPTSGHAVVLGMDCNKSSLQVRQRVGYLPGEVKLYPNFSGHKLIKLFTSIRPEQVSQEYVMYLCQRLDVDLDTPLGQLSHGNRQKIGLVLALMPQPDLLVLDEPTTGLDPLV